MTRTAHASVGGALAVAGRFANAGRPALAQALHGAATSASLHGFSVANYLAAGVAAAGALAALVLLPAHPTAAREATPSAASHLPSHARG